LIFIQYYHIFRLFQPPSGRNSHSRPSPFTLFVMSSQIWTPSHQFWCYHTISTPWKWGRCSRNVWELPHPDAAVCPRKFHWILSPRKLQDLYVFSCRICNHESSMHSFIFEVTWISKSNT